MTRARLESGVGHVVAHRSGKYGYVQECEREWPVAGYHCLQNRVVAWVLAGTVLQCD